MDPSKLTAYRESAAAAKERADKATPGPWTVFASRNVRAPDPRGGLLCPLTSSNLDEQADRNYEFVAESRQDIPSLATAVVDLCAEVERLQTRRQLVIDAFTEADKRSSEMSWAIHVLREPRGDA